MSSQRRRRIIPQPSGFGKPRRAAWWAVIGGTALITGVAWLISQVPGSPQTSTQWLAAAALGFALLEGIVLSVVAALWSNRGISLAIAASVLTALLATAGRWEITYARTNRTAEIPDLLLDFGFTMAWAVFAAIVGASVQRERLKAA